MGKVVHFEIPADEPERAIEFYSKAFGWQFNKWEGPMDYWLVMTGEGAGIDGGLVKKNGPEHPWTNTVSTEDIDAAIESVKASGGEIVVEKMPIPTVGWVAYFKDTEGNIVGMMQEDPTAGT